MPRETAFVNALRAILEWVRARLVLIILVALLIGLLVVFVIVGVFDPAWVHRFFFGEVKDAEKSRILELIGVGMGGVLLAIGATIAHRRARAMEDTAKAQVKANEGAEDGRRQDRLKNAIKHLGHESASVRLGGAYELFHLAQDTKEARDTKDLCQTAMDILCAHIRRTTSEAKYRKTYKWKPSEEIESLLNLLFIQEHAVFKGCRIDLRESWLNRAFLRSARLQGALLTRAWLQGAFVSKACLRGADLFEARIQGAELCEAHLQGANLYEAQLQGANLISAQLQGADLHGAQLQGAFLIRAHLQGATSESAAKLSFVKRIRQNIGRESDLSKTTFAGGLSQEDVDSIVKDLPDEKAKELREKLKPHVGKLASYESPEDRGAIVGVYTAEEAERWIAEYREATGEV